MALLVDTNGKMGRDYITMDKLYLITKLIGETREKIDDPEIRKRLKHYRQFISKILSGEDELIEYLQKIIISKDKVFCQSPTAKARWLVP